MTALSICQNYEMGIVIFYFIGEEMIHRKVKEVGHTVWVTQLGSGRAGIRMQKSGC